jgi:signal transduction histidine kinase
MRCPLWESRVGPGQIRVIVLFALVNVPALVLVGWLGVNLYAQRATGAAIELAEATTTVLVFGLVGGVSGNLLLYRGVTGVAVRLAEALEDCSEQRARAEAASAARLRFLSSINHEIRTPLNGVLGMAEVMSKGKLPAEQARQLETLARSAEKLACLLEQLLESGEARESSHAALLLSGDEADRERLGELLADAGCSVVAVADERAGMTELVRGVVQGSPFTLIVLTDELTPGCAEQWLRQVDKSPARCPAIVLPRKSGMRELRDALNRA